MGKGQRAWRKKLAEWQDAEVQRMEEARANWEFFRETRQHCDEQQRWRNFLAALKTLGLDPDEWRKISPQKAVSVYRRLALFAHPDKPSGSAEKFENLTCALEIVRLGISEWHDVGGDAGHDCHWVGGAATIVSQGPTTVLVAIEDNEQSMRRLLTMARAQKERDALRAAERRATASLPKVGKKGAAISISRPEDLLPASLGSH